MAKYYRVKKDTFLWKEGAIIKREGSDSGYFPIEDVWNVTEKQTEYISREIIESPAVSEFFERVYPDNLKGNIYRTTDQIRKLYSESFKE